MTSNDSDALIDAQANSDGESIAVDKDTIHPFEERFSLVGLGLTILGPIVQAIVLIPRIVDWVPIWSWYADPGYPYLLNGAVIVTGQTPGHIDHPGTSLQWLIGLVEQARFSLVGDQSNLYSDIVFNPELHAQTASGVLLTLYLLGNFFLGFQMWRYFGSVAAVVTQFLLLWGLNILSLGSFKLVAETGILIAAIYLFAVITPILKYPRQPVSPLLSVGIGVICAIGLTSKVIFIPLLLLPLVLLRRKELFIAGVAFVASIVIIMIPTYPRLSQMWTWYSSLVLSPGRHGLESNRTTLENLGLAISNIEAGSRWWIGVAATLLASTLLLIALGVTKRIDRSRTWPSVTLVLVVVGILALGAKESEIRDFVLLPLVTSVLAGVIVYSWQQLLPPIAFKTVCVPIFLLVGYLAAQGLMGTVNTFKQLDVSTSAKLTASATMNQIADEGTLIQSYDTWTETGALAFGEFWTSGEFLTAINGREPQIFEYSIFDGNIYEWSGGIRKGVVTCEKLKALAQTKETHLVVPSRGNVNYDESAGTISTPMYNLNVGVAEEIGMYANFNVYGAECKNLESE